MSLLDQIHYNDHHFKLSPVSDDTAVVRCETPGLASFQSSAAFLHEQQITELSLCRSQPGVEYHSPDTFLLYHNCYPLPLSRVDTEALTAKQKLALFCSLVKAVDRLHASHITHLNLRPSVFLLSSNLQQAQVVDLRSAQICTPQLPDIAAFTPLGADAHFLSPEQCYPSEQRVDIRTDIYALGCIGYWLFSGASLFSQLASDDEVSYAQMARPAPLLSLPSDNPCCVKLAGIVSLMLEKEAEKRYQCLSGLLTDLESLLHDNPAQCQPHINSTLSNRLLIPQQLYGRTQEIRQLMSCFNQAYHGSSEGLLIGGYSGVGKTALVNKVRQPIIELNGIFIQGKFDQYNRTTPFSAFAQAFGQFSDHLLSLSQQDIEQWRTRLISALKPNTQVIIDLIPELEHVLGKQPELSLLGPDEQKNRFNQTVIHFIQEVCSRHKPLVIFIDDLQWADVASLNLLRLLLSDRSSKHCLIIGAYRDNEIDDKHPFSQLMAEQTFNPKLKKIELLPLAQDTVQEMIADTVKRPISDVEDLAALSYEKAGGNPFFLRQFLQELYQSGEIAFNHSNSRWQWDSEEIQHRSITDNIVDLMLRKIDRLPQEAQRLLQIASCVGSRFSTPLIQKLLNTSDEQCQNSLKLCINSGLVTPIQTERRDNTPEKIKFLHDRVQQAANSMLSDTRKKSIHFQIGHLLLQQHDPEKNDLCFSIATHFTQATELIDRELLGVVATINFCAAMRAKEASAYATATSYLDNALFLSGKIEQPNSTSCINYRLEKMECLFLSAEYQAAEKISEQLKQELSGDEQRVRHANILITQYTRYGELTRAINVGLQVLDSLNFALPKSPDNNDIMTAISIACQDLETTPFPQLVNADEITDRRILLTLDILMAMQPCCYNSGSMLFPLTILGLLKLTHRHGNSPYSSYVYMMYGLLCSKALKDYPTAFSAAHHSQLIATKYPHNPLLSGRLMMMQSNFILPWQTSLRNSQEMRQNAYQHCLEQGDYYWGVHAYIFGFHAELMICPELSALQQRMQGIIRTCEDIQQPAQVFLAQQQSNLVAILQGELDNQTNLDHKPGYEQQALEHFDKHHYMCGKYDRLLGRLLQGYLFNNYEQALQVSLSDDISPTDIDEGPFHEAAYTLFNLLAIKALMQKSADKVLPRWKEWSVQAWQKYQCWHAITPQNFSAGYHLVLAEDAVIAGNDNEACHQFESAIAAADHNGMALLQGIANERAARFRLQRNQQHLAIAYFNQARDVFLAWGAYAKADDLEQQSVQLRPQELSMASPRLDWSTVSSAVEDLSGQLSGNELCQRFLLRTSLITGARRSIFYQLSDQHWHPVQTCIEHRCVSSDDSISLPPEEVLNYARNLNKTLVVKDIFDNDNTPLDSSVVFTDIRSLMVLPLMVQQELIGLLYLDHSDSGNIFTDQKVKLIELLTMQFSVNFKNTQYYNELIDINEKLETEVNHRTRQLHRKNQYLESILHTLPIPFAVSDLQGHLLQANQRFRDKFAVGDNMENYRAAQFYKRKQDRARVINALRDYQRIEDVECLLQDMNGNEFWTLLSASEIETDNGPAIFAAMTDISEHKQREIRLHEEASTDPLTQAYNRRAFFRLPTLMRQQKANRPHSIAMLDLDHFKKLNDDHGHAVGDEALRRFVASAKECLRENDVIGRIGGEEFAIFLSDIPLHHAQDVLNRLCQKTAQILVESNGDTISFTVSVGLTVWNIEESIEEVLQRADELLYEAKAAGRNRVITSPHY